MCLRSQIPVESHSFHCVSHITPCCDTERSQLAVRIAVDCDCLACHKALRSFQKKTERGPDSGLSSCYFFYFFYLFFFAKRLTVFYWKDMEAAEREGERSFMASSAFSCFSLMISACCLRTCSTCEKPPVWARSAASLMAWWRVWHWLHRNFSSGGQAIFFTKKILSSGSDQVECVSESLSSSSSCSSCKCSNFLLRSFLWMFPIAGSEFSQQCCCLHFAT